MRMEIFRPLLAFLVMAGTLGELARYRRAGRKPPWILIACGILLSFVWLLATTSMSDPVRGVWQGIVLLGLAAIFVFLFERLCDWFRARREEHVSR